MSVDDALAVADAVLFGGYTLHPYPASTLDNQLRWPFGVLAPRAWSEAGGGDAWWQETQLLVARTGPTILAGRLRFLRLCPSPDVGAERRGAWQRVRRVWDEGEARAIDFALPMTAEGVTEAQAILFSLPAARPAGADGETRSGPISGAVHLAAEPVAAAEPLSRVRIRVENLTDWTPPGATRDEALRASMLGTHVLLSAAPGTFLSVLDPPAWAAAATAACRNTRTYPVLVGRERRRDLVLSAPVILPDHPSLAPGRLGALFQAPEEKAEVRATDPRLAGLLDRATRLRPDAVEPIDPDAVR